MLAGGGSGTCAAARATVDVFGRARWREIAPDGFFRGFGRTWTVLERMKKLFSGVAGNDRLRH